MVKRTKRYVLLTLYKYKNSPSRPFYIQKCAFAPPMMNIDILHLEIKPRNQVIKIFRTVSERVLYHQVADVHVPLLEHQNLSDEQC